MTTHNNTVAGRPFDLNPRENPERARFEEWYTTHAFDYAANPIGSRDCDLQWRAWKAALASPAPSAGVWTLDDMHIGLSSNGKRPLTTQVIPRPPRLTNSEWYEYGAAVCAALQHHAAPSTGVGVEAFHPDTKRRLLERAADYDKGGEFAQAKAIGIRSAVDEIERDFVLQHPAAPSVSPAVEGDAGELPELRNMVRAMATKTHVIDRLARVDSIIEYARRLATAEQPGSAVQGENLTWALEQGGILADWCNVAGDALRLLLGAYERRVRSSCTTEADLASEPWRCAEYVQAEQALKTKPSPSVEITTPPPAPAADHIVDANKKVEARGVEGEQKLLALKPTAEMCIEGAKRLVRWEDNSKWPDSWSPAQRAAAINEAERVFRSMWLAATPNPARAEQLDFQTRVALLVGADEEDQDDIISHIQAHVSAPAAPGAAVGVDGQVTVPVRLSALHVSEIKDMIEADYNIYDAKARPLWASLLQIVAGLSIEQQEAINEQRAALAGKDGAK